MRTFSVIVLLGVFVIPTVAFAEIQTFTATHTYTLGDHDSKDDARQRCVLEAKRKILEQAGVYIESASEVKDFDLTKDKISSFAAAVMQVKDTKEEVGFQQGHMTLTLKLTAQVDLAEMRKQLAVRQVDTGVREDVAVQKERLKYLEAQFEAMQREIQQTPGRTLAPPPTRNLSTSEMQRLRTQADQGDADAQSHLGALYLLGWGVQQDDVQAAKWSDKAAAQGDADGQFLLGLLYSLGRGVPEDYAQAAQWYQKAAAQGNAQAQGRLGTLYDFGLGIPQDYVQAQQWYQKAATQGLAAAQFHLGVLYLTGGGVHQDYVQAAKWFEKAAARGNAEAQWALGNQYARGMGVPQDNVLSYMWYSLAVQGNLGSRYSVSESLEGLQKIMTPAQIAEAQKLAQEWTPKK